MMLRAVVTGAGQDSSYLADLLLEKGYEVLVFTRRRSVNNENENLKHIIDHPNLTVMHGDITDPTFVGRILHDFKPHEYYGLAAQSHVGYSFKDPVHTFDVTGRAVVMQLDLIREFSPATRFYNAATSELFGGLHVPDTGYTEESPFYPRSPYAVAKAAGFYATRNYREAYGLFACSGILFNHSSPRRGHDFATRKMTRGIAKVKLGMEEHLRMGNLEPYRDEGHAKDYVKAQWLMLQQEEPDDFVIATGYGASIEDMFKYICDLAGLKFEDVYRSDPRFMRPSDVPFLRGDPSKAKTVLGWEPEYDWQKLLKEMYEADLAELDV
jgi:GDPmannose 4,6-dehydratase